MKGFLKNHVFFCQIALIALVKVLYSVWVGETGEHDNYTVKFYFEHQKQTV